MEAVGENIVKTFLEVSDLNIFVHSGCVRGRDQQQPATYCFIFLFAFSDSVALLYCFDCNRSGKMYL